MIDTELHKLVENFINSSGGAYSLVSARELNDEPKCLLSGDFLCSEVVAHSSQEIVEYFKQGTRNVTNILINRFLCTWIFIELIKLVILSVFCDPC